MKEGMQHFAAMSAARKKRRGQYGAPTGKQMQVTDQSRVLPEDQVGGLIDAVLAGQDVEETIEATVGEIYEGSGCGPFPIGSSVKMNQPWVGNDVAGKPVSLSKGEVVTILMPNLGEHGQDKMVLLPGGADKAIVPLHVLGEAMVDEGHSDGGYHGDGGDSTNPKRGPSGHKVTPAKGSPQGAKSGKFQGGPKPDDVPQVRGAGSATSMAGKPQGKGMPGADPSAQLPGSPAPSSHQGVAVEDIGEMFGQLLDETADPIMYRRISELARTVYEVNDPGLFDIIAEAFSENSPIHIKDLEWLFEQEDNGNGDDDEFMKNMNNKERKEFGAMTPSERKKYRKKYAFRMKYRKKYGEEEVQGMPEGMQHMMAAMKASKKKRGQYGCK